MASERTRLFERLKSALEEGIALERGALKLRAHENRRKFTRDEFYAIAELGIFDDEYRVELVDGCIVTDPAQPGGEHGWAVSNLARLLIETLRDTEDRVHVHGGVSLPGDSVLQPDFAVFTPIPERGRQNPTVDQISLIVEVSDQTLRHDLTDRMLICAEAGVPVYWVADLRHKHVIVYKRPEDGIYTHVEQFSKEQKLQMYSREIAVSEIF